VTDVFLPLFDAQLDSFCLVEALVRCRSANTAALVGDLDRIADLIAQHRTFRFARSRPPLGDRDLTLIGED